MTGAPPPPDGPDPRAAWMVVRDAQDIVPPGQELPPLMLPFEAGDPRGTTGGEGPHGPAGAAVDARGTTAADPSAGPPPGTRGPVPAVAAVVRLWTGGGPAGGARGSAPGSAPRAAGSGDVSGGGGARTAGRMSGSPPGPGGPGAHPYAATGGVRTGRETAPDGPSGAVRADRGGGTADPGAEGRRLGNVLARAAAVTAGLTVAGAVLGLVRDQTIAQIYGASTESDAFLVAWTVPEMAATLLIEDAMALLLVPAFSHAIAHRAAPGAADGRLPGGGGEDPVRRLVSATFPRFLAVLTVATGVLVVFAPEFVHALAPGFRDPGLAADCTRLTALTVLTYGVAGYFSAALRAHGRFLHPAAVYIASNVGIIGTTLLLHSVWGVRGAATGVAVGGLLMVLVQLPSVVRHVALPPLGRRRAARPRPAPASASTLASAPASAAGPAAAPVPGGPRPAPAAVAPAAAAPTAATPAAGGRIAGPAVGMALLAPIVFFAVSRQAQVLVERFLASSLPGGAISHLNYAQKIAQMPMVLSLMFCTVTFPVVAQAMAGGDHERARRRVEHDLALAGLVVLLGTALILGCAPQIVDVLFERGAFDARDTATTASVMRVYALGLIGHTLVGALGRPFFSSGRPTWFPAAAMAVGLAVTVLAGSLAVGPLGVHGIAAANAAGICVTALLLLRGLGPRVVAIEVRAVSRAIGRLAVATAAAALAGRLACPLLDAALPGPAALLGGALVVSAVFAATGYAVRAPEVVHLLALVRRRVRHVR